MTIWRKKKKKKQTNWNYTWPSNCVFVISWQFLFWVFSWLWDDRSLYHLHYFQWPVKLFHEFNTHSPGSISAVLMFLQINVILYLHPTTNISNKIMRFLLLKLNIQQSLKTYSFKCSNFKIIKLKVKLIEEEYLIININIKLN